MMKILSCIKQPQVIEHILRHCNLWKEAKPRPPPEICPPRPALPAARRGRLALGEAGVISPSQEDPLPDYTVFEDLPSYDN
ncbi:MAG: hypothetical protein A2350_02385 [Candidatus Raymondbacteria bacterium RifOxyB12_full_50_8]|nr:MAG: hypothetical protein A2350_02385 [Candidatus Raymondbacteria bacterium RifOxyB12_full_50_8]